MVEYIEFLRSIPLNLWIIFFTFFVPFLAMFPILYITDANNYFNYYLRKNKND